MGELIPPESFQSVSLMLADIVDFSSITSASTPMQVWTCQMTISFQSKCGSIKTNGGVVPMNPLLIRQAIVVERVIFSNILQVHNF